MTSPPITEQQALFIASLPDVYCDLTYAIWTYAFTNRVAAIDEETARDAIALGLGANFVETDDEGIARLAGHLRRERDALVISEGCFELAVYEVSRLILDIR